VERAAFLHSAAGSTVHSFWRRANNAVARQHQRHGHGRFAVFTTATGHPPPGRLGDRYRLHAAAHSAAAVSRSARPAHSRRPRHAAAPGGPRIRALVRRAARGDGPTARQDHGDALMYRLGLTGSIATGKSTTLQAFADLDIPVFSADAAVHELYEGEAVAAVAALFPGVAPDGVIERTELSRQLLEQPEKLAALEAIVHPMVRRRIAAFFSDAEAAGAPLAVADIPLLFENDVDWGLDGVAVTVVDDAEQRRRVLARPGMTVDKLEAILAR